MSVFPQERQKRENIGLVPLPEELITLLKVNERVITRMSCSPFNQRELAVGWLYCQGIIEDYSDIEKMDISDGASEMRVWLKKDKVKKIESLKSATASSSGGGFFNLRILDSITPLIRDYNLDLNRLINLARTMMEMAELYKLHGGIHCSMLTDSLNDKIIVLFEDIGRNNAIDKVIGWGVTRKLDFSSLLLFVTGRISVDMIFKCLRAGIATIISLNTATTFAFEIANKVEMTLICHVLKPRPILINY